MKSIGAHRRMKLGFVLGALIAWAGCSDGKIARYPVHGSVNIDGKPAEGVMLIFCPVGGSDELQKKRPTGVTDSEGKFQLTTIGNNDGAPPGEYKVMAQWFGKISKDRFGRPAIEGDDRFKGKYMNLEKSELNATIKGATDLPPFELKTK